MANWAKLQEDTLGLKVVKRAKHAIHFDNGNGEVQALFSGKPCHYFDGGLWKPIDTKLIATPDGWYTAPHSGVLIHPDGRVKVKNADYQQFAELPGASIGKLDGDKIIRTFPGGEQHLILKEDGYREEIHIQKPTFPIEKFIARTSGTLPTAYTAHPVTVEDAKGNSFTFTGDVKALGDWLDKAVYPVVIDPDLNLQPNATDGMDSWIYYTGGETNNYGSDDRVLIGCGNPISELTFRELIKFNVSSIPSGSNITSAAVSLYCHGGYTTSDKTIKAHRLTQEWVEGEVTAIIRKTGTNWSTKGGDGDYSATETASTNVSVYSSWYDWNIKSDVEAWVGGGANYGNIFIGNESDTLSRKMFRSSDYTGDITQRPKLAVVYAAGGALLKINMNGQMQSMTGGMRG